MSSSFYDGKAKKNGVNGLIAALNLNFQTNFMISGSIRIDFMTFYDIMTFNRKFLFFMTFYEFVNDKWEV
jgi:hypothetical protein